MKPKKQIMIPRTKQEDRRFRSWGDGAVGSIPHWAPPESDAYDWSPADPFKLPEGGLSFRGMQRGRSAAYAVLTLAGEGRLKFTLEDEEGLASSVRYSMFLTDLDDVLQAEGVADGKWCPPCGVAIPVKRGQNFGIRRLTDEELKAWIKGNAGFQEVAAKLQRSSMEGVGEVDVNLCREILASDPPSATIGGER